MNTSVHPTLSIFQNHKKGDLEKLPSETFKLATSYLSKDQISQINLAYCVAKEAHQDQKRREGSPLAFSSLNSIDASSLDPRSVRRFFKSSKVGGSINIEA